MVADTQLVLVFVNIEKDINVSDSDEPIPRVSTHSELNSAPPSAAYIRQ